MDEAGAARLKAAIAAVREDKLQPAFKMLARISRIMAQLIQAWDVLSTLTPSEYLDFRHKLGKSSGFQSYQYRTIEFLLGNKSRELVAPHRHKPEVAGPLTQALESPSLYDEAIRLLARRGFKIDKAALERDWSLPYQPNKSVEAAWMAIYRDTTKHWGLYELAEELVDLEDFFRQWRFRHVTTVERVIRIPARHGWHGGGCVFAQIAGGSPVSGAVGPPHGIIGDEKTPP